MIPGLELDRVGDDRVGVELDQVEPAEGRGVLVLLASGDPQVVPLDLVVQLGLLVTIEGCARCSRRPPR